MGDGKAGGKVSSLAAHVDLSNMYQYTAKNTFVNIVEAQDGWNFVRRPNSAPASNSASNDGSLSSHDLGSKSSSTLANMDLLLKPSGPKSGADDYDVESLSDDDDAQAGGTAPASGAEAPPAKKENRRPCKNQRERYRKLVLRLEEQVRADPFGFNFERCQLPPSVTGDAKLRAKLQKRLEQFAEGLQAELRAPSSSTANQLPVGAPGFAQRQQMEPGMPSTSAFYASGAPSGSGAASSVSPPAASSGFGPASSAWVGVMKISL